MGPTSFSFKCSSSSMSSCSCCCSSCCAARRSTSAACALPNLSWADSNSDLPLFAAAAAAFASCTALCSLSSSSSSLFLIFCKKGNWAYSDKVYATELIQTRHVHAECTSTPAPANAPAGILQIHLFLKTKGVVFHSESLSR